MSDWIGLIFLLLLIAAAYFGLRALANPKKHTEAEFEKGVSLGSGLAGAGMSALNEALNPQAARGKEAVMQLKGGRFNKKRKEGKSGGNASEEEGDIGESAQELI